MNTKIRKKFRTAQIRNPDRATFIIPAFIYSANVWAGASVLFAQFPFENTDYKFSLKRPTNQFGSAFLAAVRWAEDGVWYRFKLWDPSDAVLHFPIYSGERIGLNAILELWSVNSSAMPTLSSAHTLYSSVLVFAQDEQGNCCCCTDFSSSLTLSAQSPSTLPPYAECNPFCFDLCES